MRTRDRPRMHARPAAGARAAGAAPRRSSACTGAVSPWGGFGVALGIVMSEPPQLPPHRRAGWQKPSSKVPELYSDEWYAAQGKEKRASTPQRQTGEEVVADRTPTSPAVTEPREERSSLPSSSRRSHAMTPAKRAERARLRARLARAEKKASADGPALHSNPSFKQDGNEAVVPDDASWGDVPATLTASGRTTPAVPKSGLGRKAQALARRSGAADAPSDQPQENEEAPHPEPEPVTHPVTQPKLPDLSEIDGLDPEYESWIAGIMFGAEMLAELLDVNDDTAAEPGKAAVAKALYDVHFEALEMARAAAPRIRGHSATQNNGSAQSGPQGGGQFVKLGNKWVVRSGAIAANATEQAKMDTRALRGDLKRL